MVEALFCAPLVVLPPSRPLPPHLPPAGHVWTVAWQDEAQGYTLSSSPSTFPKKRLLAHGTISDASVDRFGWWQLALDMLTTDLDLDGHEDKGAEYKKGNLGRSNDNAYEDEDAAWMLRRWYSAGLLEGYLTAPLIAEYAYNAKHSLFGAHHYPR